MSHDEFSGTSWVIFEKSPSKYIGISVGGMLKYFDGSQLGFTPQIPISQLYRKGTIVFTYNNTTKIMMVYIDGLYAGQCTFINPIGTTSFASVFNSGGYGGKQIDGVVKDISIYNRVISTQEIKAYHNSFNEITLHETFDDMAVGSSRLPNGWIKNGGSFVCEENTTNDPVIKLIRKGTKYLKCVTAGIVAIPCKQAYGTWEFDWFKGSDTNTMLISFIQTQISGYPAGFGYTFRVIANECIAITKHSGGAADLMLTNTSYINNNTWYRIRITRTTLGVFTVYILGGNFTNWTLVSTTGGSGTNPVTDNTYTTSSYFVMDLDANDRVSGINIQSQIKV